MLDENKANTQINTELKCPRHQFKFRQQGVAPDLPKVEYFRRLKPVLINEIPNDSLYNYFSIMWYMIYMNLTISLDELKGNFLTFIF